MRLVLDTNIIASGVFWRGAPFHVLEAWMNEAFEVITSEEVLLEYSRVLTELEKKNRNALGLAKHWLLFIAQNSTLIKVKSKVKVCRDPFDDMFLSLAIDGKAKFVASGDKDLLSLKNYMNVEIITANKLLKELKVK